MTQNESVHHSVDHERTFSKKYTEKDGTRCRISARVRYGDALRNRHNTLAVTGDIDEHRNGRWQESSGGAIHDDIARHFPELRDAIRFHLVSTDGPMHYLANTLYFAGDRDHSGRRKGEPSSTETRIRFGNNPIKHAVGTNWTRNRFMSFLREHEAGGFDLEVVAVEYTDERETGYTFGPKYTFGGFGTEWHSCPFETQAEASEFLAALQTCGPVFETVETAWSDGKEPELEKARSAAMWPDATPAQLTDRGALEARIPGLLEEFRAVVESFGFEY